MYTRDISDGLKQFALSYPIVTVIGPRQSGKTTLVRSVFPDKAYVNLEAIDTQEFAKSDPRGFLERYKEGAIFEQM